MLKLIIEKELKEIIGSTKFIITFGTCTILILLTFYMGAKNYQVSKSQYELSLSANLKQLEKNTDWLTIKHRIFLPPQPLAVLVNGISNDIERNISIAGLGELIAEDSKYNDDPVYAIFRFLDLEFIFQIVLSLFAILFAYNAINGEKELGTLRLSFANPLPRSTYILGKLIGSYLALGLPLFIPIFLGSLILPLYGINLNSQEWTELSLIIFLGILYVGVFLTLAIFISSSTRSSSSSFIISLVVWIFAILIIPRASVLLAGRAVYVPTVDEIQSQKNKFNSQVFTEDREKMKNFKPSSTQDFIKEFESFMQDISEKRDIKTKEFAQKLNEDRHNRQMVQQKLSFSIARISPSAIFSLAASNLAGTSLDLKDNYLQQAADYQKQFADFQKKKTGGMNSGSNFMMRIVVGDNDERQKNIDIKEMPEFQFKPVPISERFASSLFDILLLFLFNVAFFLGSFFSFLKYDLR